VKSRHRTVVPALARARVSDDTELEVFVPYWNLPLRFGSGVLYCDGASMLVPAVFRD